MTTDYANPPEHLRSMDEVVADLTAAIQRLGFTDPNRLKPATWIEVLEDWIASRGQGERAAPREG
jgi:hypothetical protein